MTVEILQTLSLVSFIIAGVLFLASVALFFLLEVPKLYGDISGRTAKKAIENIKKQSEGSSGKGYKSGSVNKANRNSVNSMPQAYESKSQNSRLSLENNDNVTLPLNSQFNETAVLNIENDNTTLLAPDIASSSETTVLLSNNIAEAAHSNLNSMHFSVDIELSFLGSSELIE